MAEADDLVKLARECGAMTICISEDYEPGSLVLLTSQLEAFASRIAAQKDAPQTAPVQQALTDEEWYDLAQKYAAKDWNNDLYFSLVQAVGKDAIALALASRASEPEWIDVNDRKPEKNIEVLIAFRDVSLPATGQYTASPLDTWGWCFPSENDPDDCGPITHWRPLPEHPYEDKFRRPPRAEAPKEGA